LGGLDRELRDLVVDNRIGVLDPLFEALSYAGSFGFVWLAIGCVILLSLTLTGREPVLAGPDRDEAIR